ncbi:MAG: ATP-binding cassette domain-containing protein [Acidobacteriota bacterium]
MNIVELNHVTKRFDEFVAVDDLSFTVKQGTIFGFLGPNGAGKTTSIRMIVNITAPDEGEIKVLGNHITPEIQQRLGYLPEERGLYKKMKVGEQLIFFASLKGIEAKEADRRATYWLERLEIGNWKNKTPVEMSKGMQQKAQFVSTIIHEPDILILDEPFSGLDPVSTDELKKIILEMKQRGKTILFSTHQMEQVEQMCDDICLINQSKKVLIGSLKEVKRSFGKNTVIIDYESERDFLSEEMIKQQKRFANYSELVLNDGVDAQILLQQAVSAGARIYRFELVEPSLTDIFIESVKRTNGNKR